MLYFLKVNSIDVLIAVIIDFIIGDPYGFPHPVIYMGKLIKNLENYSRSKSKSAKELKASGAIIVLIIITLSFLIPFIILYLLWPYKLLFHIANIVFLWTTLAAKSLYKESMKVYDSLKKDDLMDSRLKLSYIVGRDTSSLNCKEITRAAVETVAENASDGVIAPLIYGLLGGAPLAMLYKAVNTMDSMLGYMNDKYLHIGFFPAKTDDVFNLIPARLTGILICLSAPVVKGSMGKSFKILIRDRKNHKSPNCAYPEAAAAGALKVQLGGTNIYFGIPVEKPTIGDPENSLEYSHIKDCNVLMFSSEIILLLVAEIIINLIL